MCRYVQYVSAEVLGGPAPAITKKKRESAVCRCSPQLLTFTNIPSPAVITVDVLCKYNDISVIAKGE